MDNWSVLDVAYDLRDESDSFSIGNEDEEALMGVGAVATEHPPLTYKSAPVAK